MSGQELLYLGGSRKFSVLETPGQVRCCCCERFCSSTQQIVSGHSNQEVEAQLEGGRAGPRQERPIPPSLAGKSGKAGPAGTRILDSSG